MPVGVPPLLRKHWIMNSWLSAVRIKSMRPAEQKSQQQRVRVWQLMPRAMEPPAGSCSRPGLVCERRKSNQIDADAAAGNLQSRRHFFFATARCSSLQDTLLHTFREVRASSPPARSHSKRSSPFWRAVETVVPSTPGPLRFLLLSVCREN